MKKYILISLLCIIFSFHNSILAQEKEKNQTLSIEKIMQDPNDWVGSLPESIFWSRDSKTIFFEWNPENKPVKELYKIKREKPLPKKVSKKEKEKLPPRSAQKNTKRDKMVFSKNGDLYIYDLSENNSRPIIKTYNTIKSPRFTHNDEAITFLMNEDFYLWDLKEKKLTQLVDFKREAPPSKKGKKRNHQEKWLYNQQMDLFKVLKRREMKKNYLDSIKESPSHEKTKTIYLDNGFTSNVRLSPGGKYITYNHYKRGKSKSTKVPRFINNSGYMKIENARSKVGGNQHQYELNIYNIENDTVYQVNTSGIPGIKDQPEYLSDCKEEEKTRKVFTYGPYWSDNGKKALISVRSADNKDRWLMLLDPSTGKPELLNRERDEAWIAGPGITRSGWGEKMGWLPDSKHIWYQSEESGYSHLYLLNTENNKKKQLTKGKFEIYNPRISKNKQYWYFSSNRVHPGERQFYKMPLMGGKMEQLTFMEGRNDATLSPDEKYLAIRHSSSNQPWEIYLKENSPEAKPRRLTHSLTDGFMSYNWRKPEIVTFKANDGAKVYARLYKPDNTENENNPAVIYVHGAGYLQNAHKWWSKYFREYMFHNLLVDRGYTILDIDYRGSAGYGRNWRTGIYRHMGGKDLSDHVDGAEYLISKHKVDPEKIGIYGGSYGGFITLMGLFKYPETFSAGAALRAVTDWAHYNHSYTSDILNEPTKDSIAYRRSSPIYFAEGLNDPLLICHGMIDDNVQFQDVVRLTQKLIELGKEDWELAVYPLERHSFKEPESWTDEYKRIYKLFEKNLK